MNRFAVALVILLSAVGGLMACPSVSYSPSYHSASYAAPYVSPVYPSVATTEVSVRINLAQYSAYLAPAIAVPYVQPPVPAAALIPQTPTVAIAAPVAAVAAAPVCPPAAMPAAPVAAAASEDFCKLVLARLDKIDARQTAFEARLSGAVDARTTAPPMPKPEAVAPGKATNLTTTCASCHGAVTPYHDAAGKLAPTFFAADGAPRMTDTQIRKAIRQIKAQKMPPPDTAAAKAATPDALNACLDELDELTAVEGKATP